jgi:predicted DsbA family dithiol-disulfide isomerase
VSLKPLEDEGVAIHWRAWKMPEGANPPEKPEGYGEEAKAFLQKLIQEAGLEVRPPSDKRDTFLAHVGAKFAKEKGVFQAYHKRVFEAVWKHDENIGDVAILRSIAQEVGLNPDEFEKAIHLDQYKDKVEADFQFAAERKAWTIPVYIGEKGEIHVHHFKDIPSVDQIKEIL